MARAIGVRVIPPYTIEVAFSDGTDRCIGLEEELWGEVFEPLRDPALFSQAALDPTFGSVYWPTGADLAPEFLAGANEDAPPGRHDRTDRGPVEPAPTATGHP